MLFCMSILNIQNADPWQKDGSLHMIGSLSEILMKKKEYKRQMDKMLLQYVVPEFHSPYGHMRARVIIFKIQ